MSTASMLNAQGAYGDTLYYDNEGNVSPKELAYYYKIFYQDQERNRITEKTFYAHHSMRTCKHFKDQKLHIKIDTSKAFYPKGHLHWFAAYDKNGKMIRLEQFYKNGQKKRIEYYKNGEFSRGKKYDQSGRRIKFTSFNKPPVYQGGYDRMIAYLNRTIQYPKRAKALNISGTVLVSFIVTKAGKVEQARIEQSVDPILNKEALRVVRTMKQWVAGTVDDQKVNSRISIPITFGKPMAEEHIPGGD